MGEKTERGFTVIEVLLFLAITALLVFALMGGWTLSMNTQSYRDSMRSTVGFLQQQYANTANVSIFDRPNSNTYGCTGNPGDITPKTTITSAGTTPRGQGECMVLGNYLVIDGRNPSNIKSFPIIGYESKTALGIDSTSTEASAIKAYDPQRVDTDAAGLSSEEFAIPWTARPYMAGDKSTNIAVAMVIIRSPVSGIIHTYIQQNITDVANPPKVTDVINVAGSSNAFVFCLDPEAAVAGNIQAIEIRANAASADAVRINAEGAGC